MTMTRTILPVVVKTVEGEQPALAALRDGDGFLHAALTELVAEAIRRCRWQHGDEWLGPVAAIRAVETWIIDHTDPTPDPT